MPASLRLRSNVRISWAVFTPTTWGSGRWAAPNPISRWGDNKQRSAHSRVVFSNARGVRSPAARAISAANEIISSLDFKKPSALRRSIWRSCSGTSCRTQSRTSATGPSVRSFMRTALVITASKSLSLAKIKDLAACSVDRGPRPATKCETHSIALLANRSRV